MNTKNKINMKTFLYAKHKSIRKSSLSKCNKLSETEKFRCILWKVSTM